MKVLVTGASGFIGGHVIRNLLDSGVKVIATSKSPEKAKHKSWFDQVVYKSYDISTPPSDNLFTYFDQPDICIHLAWGGLPDYKNPDHEQLYPSLHFEFLSRLIDDGLKNLTVTGTCLEYGLTEGALTEDMEALPVTAYGRGKKELYQRLLPYGETRECKLTWLRLFYMYGDGQSEKSLVSQLESAIESGEEVFNMSEGDQERDYLPVSELAQLVVNLALKKEHFGVVNVCSGKPVKIGEMVEEYCRNKNTSIKLNKGFYPYPDYEPFAFWGSTEKLKNCLNYGKE